MLQLQLIPTKWCAWDSRKEDNEQCYSFELVCRTFQPQNLLQLTKAPSGSHVLRPNPC